MNKYLILLFILINATSFRIEGKSTLVFSKFQKKILHKISQEEKMLKSVSRPSVNLQHRLFELYAEKNKIMFEVENRSYIKHAVSGKKKISYFPRSYKSYKYIHKLGLLITLKNPHFYANDEIYYTLAQISHDFDGDKFTRLYLRKALKITKKRKLRYKIEKDLAEYYFNKKKFKTAGAFFTNAIKYNTPWTTKHMYNLAWCQQMRKNFPQSLKTLLKAYTLSNKKGYININEQILKSSVVFFDLAKQIPAGIDFYIKNSNAPVEYLLRLAKRTNKNGHWDGSYKIIKKINSLISYKSNPKQYMTAKNFELNTYQEFKKYSLFLKLAKDFQLLAKKKLVTSFSDEIILMIEHRNEYLQKMLVALFKKNDQINHRTANKISSYFEILKSINPSRLCAYEYHQGENLFFIKSYLKAINNYKQAINYCTASKEREYLLKDINSLLGTIALVKSKQKPAFTNPLLILAYQTYIKNWPKGKSAQNYLEEIFKIHHKQNNIASMQRTLHLYVKKHPRSYQQIKPMVLTITDYYIKHNDQKNISHILKYIHKKKIPFSKSTITNITTSLGNIVFKSLEKSTGDKLTDGLKQVFKSPLYPHKIKMEATLKLALVHASNNNSKLFNKWIVSFSTIATEKQFRKYRKEVFAAIYKLYLTGKYSALVETSQNISHRCMQFSKNQRNSLVEIIKNAQLMKNKLNINKTNMSNMFLISSCQPDEAIITQIKIDIYGYYVFNQNLKKTISWAKEISNTEVSIIFDFYIQKFWSNLMQELPTKQLLNKISLFKHEIPATKLTDFHAQIATFKSIGQLTDKLADTHFKVPSPFKEELFNSRLEQFLEKVGAHSESIQQLVSTLPAEVTITILDKLAQSYKYKATELRSAKLKGLEKNYQKSINKVLIQLSNMLTQKSSRITRAKNRSLRGNAIKDKTNIALNNYDLAMSSLNVETVLYLSFDNVAQGRR